VDKICLSDAVIVFDLDDTLYFEADYVRSGIRFVFEFVSTELEQDLPEKLLEELLGGEQELPAGDWLQRLLADGNVQSSKESLLWLYRLHPPKIQLESSTSEFLAWLRERCPIMIVTDGRVVTQTLKLNALGLKNVPHLISEQYQSEKPDERRFKLIMQQYPNKSEFLYVGDNLKKDFVAPNRLGWTTIGLLPNPRMVHRSATGEEMPTVNRPTVWINHLTDAKDYLKE
jgi:putative hydrolase of the HAD superfamily